MGFFRAVLRVAGVCAVHRCAAAGDPTPSAKFLQSPRTAVPLPLPPGRLAAGPPLSAASAPLTFVEAEFRRAGDADGQSVVVRRALVDTGSSDCELREATTQRGKLRAIDDGTVTQPSGGPFWVPVLLLAWDVPNFFVLRDKEAILPKPRLVQRAPDEGEDIILDVVTSTKETPVNVKVVVGKVAYATAARHERKPPPRTVLLYEFVELQTHAMFRKIQPLPVIQEGVVYETATGVEAFDVFEVQISVQGRSCVAAMTVVPEARFAPGAEDPCTDDAIIGHMALANVAAVGHRWLRNVWALRAVRSRLFGASKADAPQMRRCSVLGIPGFWSSVHEMLRSAPMAAKGTGQQDPGCNMAFTYEWGL
ncbi:hypothetical protein AK812_SmicGene8643 [Symbiodinium microadriaticum]|uniref:Peptidase A2 domain-containing protein n=1 Tax=Symbiodinium microadriaticum TaxID=2951 RepID=A0A1Q9EKF0_SYMMI|nr:hypothetical protein AK812_SmicGene8643 [Symbiodinium microadriaticum]